jgi:hypothetical protein
MSVSIDPRFLDLSTSWRSVVSLTPRPLYPHHHLDRRLGSPQRLSGRHEEIKVLDPTGSRTATPRSGRRRAECAILVPGHVIIINGNLLTRETNGRKRIFTVDIRLWIIACMVLFPLYLLEPISEGNFLW